MSGSSLSPTPTRNLSDSNTANYPQSTPTTSRPHILEDSPSERLVVREYREPVTVRLSPPPPPQEAPRAESSSARLRRRRSIEENSPEEPMAKRIRRGSLDTTTARRPDSSPSSDSQDDMADNEMDVARARHHPEPMPPASVPPKKKRTRTLTTPHQSAVLHALLAQSRFPTTAMREEVGRSIGLSARKVQIWFQNQRQKARRPRSQSDNPSNRQTQYGPFPSVSESVPHVHHGFEDRGMERMYYARHPSPEPPHPVSAEIPARLLGPGMPGITIFPPPRYRQVRAPPLSPPTVANTSYESGAPTLPRVLSPEPYRSPPMYALPGVRPATSQPSSWRERDPSRTLPPLELTRPSSSFGSRRIQSTVGPVYPISRPPFAPTRSLSPEARFAHLPPEPTPRPTITLPPPFTLQPSPQWDEASYAPRPSSSAWSRPGSRSTRGRSTSPVAVRRAEHMGSVTESPDTYYLAEHPGIHHSSSPRSIPPVSTPPPSRSARYDPVRATYVPFSSTPSVSPAISPAGAAGGGGAADERRAERKSSPVRDEDR